VNFVPCSVFGKKAFILHTDANEENRGHHPKTILEVATDFQIMSEAMTRQYIGYVALLVRSYDEARAWYCDTLGFTLIEDTPLSDGKRWLLVAPPGSTETRVLLAEAATPEQASRVGDQTGGRVFLFLHTESFWASFSEMKAKGVRFCEEPRQESYGTVAVFEDLYGNRWDLLQSSAA
jgi:catechol 2,3-dioxygenase-like lactoylglutathione lyase family enzyme